MASSNENAGNQSEYEGVPAAVISRLSLYLRELQHLILEGKETVSSKKLGRILGFSDAQVRKDLGYFGQFGYRGIGYRCQELIKEIKRILGTDREWPVALVGCGNMGQALLGYGGFDQQGFRIVAAFDISDEKVGTEIHDLKVRPLDEIGDVVKELGIQLAILAVPATSAQEVAEQLVEVGVKGILNFAPVSLSLKKSVSNVGVDLAIELEQLSFNVVKIEKKK